CRRSASTCGASRRCPSMLRRATWPNRSVAARRRSCRLQVLVRDECLVDEAPLPALSRLEAADERVARGVEVLRRVLVPGRVAAADVAADLTETEMDPVVSDLQAVLAARGARGHVATLIEVRADFAHVRLLQERRSETQGAR